MDNKWRFKRLNLASLSFSRLGDLSSVLSLLEEPFTVSSGAYGDEMCKALKISIYIKNKVCMSYVINRNTKTTFYFTDILNQFIYFSSDICCNTFVGNNPEIKMFSAPYLLHI